MIKGDKFITSKKYISEQSPYRRRTQNSAITYKWSFLRKKVMAEVVNYFHEKLSLLDAWQSPEYSSSFEIRIIFQEMS